jgi:hypothetical protein
MIGDLVRYRLDKKQRVWVESRSRDDGLVDILRNDPDIGNGIERRSARQDDLELIARPAFLASPSVTWDLDGRRCEVVADDGASGTVRVQFTDDLVDVLSGGERVVFSDQRSTVAKDQLALQNVVAILRGER